MTSARDKFWPETFRYAAEHSPYYRELFRGVTNVPPFEMVPTVEKNILSQRNMDFLCVPREAVVEIVTTSGTTGHPLMWMLTRSDLRRLAENERMSFECAGLTARDTVLVAVAIDRCFVAGLAYVSGLHKLGCAVVRVGPSSPLLVLEMIRRVQPTAIVGVPSFLKLVAEKARETGLDLATTGIKKAICIGEPVRKQDFGLNAAGQCIEASWGARVYSTYGVTELANSLCECEAGAGGHLHDTQLHLESLDDDGNPIPDGHVGEIVATTFGVEAMPLIRYRTGDCAALFRGPCSCGRTALRLGPIVSRKNHKLKVKGASLFPAAFAEALEENKDVTAFVVIARKESELSDSVEIVYHGAASESFLRETLQARTGIVPGIRRASRDEIAALQLPRNARKAQTFVDLR